MNDCLFCKIARGELETALVFENERVVAFSDINPQAPHHYLIIPREHISTLNDIDASNSAIISDLYQAAIGLAKKLNVSESGYRLLMNCNEDGGQTVFHIHLHLLAGRPLLWPPG